MTFFLKDGALPEVAARGVDTPIPSFWGGVSASFRKEQIETNASFRVQNMMQEERRGLSQQVIDASQGEVIRSYYGERGLDVGEDLEAARRNFEMTPDAQAYALKYARDRGLEIDTSEDAITARVNERLAKEYKDATDTLAASNGGIGAFLGGMAGMIYDVRQIPFVFAGGPGGSLWRVMGREAMLNVAAESVTLPSRYEMAETLNIPDPDVPTTLAMAAIGGAALGGAMEGLGRAITYWRGTRGAPSERVAGYDVEMNVDVAEDAIADGARVFDVVPERIREEPKAPDAPAASPDAQAARLSDEVVTTGRATEAASEAPPSVSPPRSAEQALSDLFDQPGARTGVGERQMDIEDLIAESRAADPEPPAPAPRVDVPDDPLPQALERRLNSAAGGNRPLINHLKSRYGGISPSSRLGQELRAMGIRTQDVPGLFRNAGREGFDNIPVAEEPHLAQVLGDDGNGYIREDALAAAIADELGGQPLPVTREQQEARIELEERRTEQERREREAAIAAGRELDEELFRLPDPPGWLDDPRAVEAVEAHAIASLRDEVELAPAGPRVDPDKPAFMDTRGEGVRYHGSRSANTGITEGHYASLNYYGNGFYTTDAVSIGHGYAGGDKGFLYEVVETQPVRALDMEGPVPDFLRRMIETERREFSLERSALDEQPANLRELFDNIREMSSYEGVSADGVQEIFEEFYYLFRQNGFNAIDHVGGLRTTKTPHNVRIYLDPETTIRLEKRSFDEFRAPEQAAPVPQAAETPAPQPRAEQTARPVDPATAEMRTEGGRLVDMGDGRGERPLSSVLDELEADADFAEVVGLCGRVPF